MKTEFGIVLTFKYSGKKRVFGIPGRELVLISKYFFLPGGDNESNINKKSTSRFWEMLGKIN